MDFSVIVPTYQRRDLVVATVRALARQDYAGPFEVIVVVDGSSDGTVQALRALDMPFPLTVLEHSNQGLAVTRNRGASVAKGQWLLFLDDDMEAAPGLLAAHARSLRSGADAVTGHVPLHPRSPANCLSASVKAWADDRAKILLASQPSIDFLEVVGGQLSISRRLFVELGGFDTAFTRGGTFGNEDRDFAIRLLQAGYRVVFNPEAVSWQNYVVRPSRFLRNYRQAGAADVMLAAKHPGLAGRIFNAECVESRMDALMWRRFRWPASRLASTLIEAGREYRWCVRLFWWAWRMEYCQGVREAKRASENVGVSERR